MTKVQSHNYNGSVKPYTMIITSRTWGALYKFCDSFKLLNNPFYCAYFYARDTRVATT